MKKLLLVVAVFGAAVLGYRLLGTSEASEPAEAKESVHEPEHSTEVTQKNERAAMKRERGATGSSGLRADDGVRADPEKVREGLMRMLGQDQGAQEPKHEAAAEAHPQQPAELEVAIRARQAATASGELSSAEARVLSMYERMGQAFESHANDCVKMGQTVLAIANEDRQSLSALSASWDGLSPEQRGSEQERIEKVMGDGVETLRQTFRRGLAKCADNEDLKSALRVLADASEPLAAAE
jgi:hypothetical protein